MSRTILAAATGAALMLLPLQAAAHDEPVAGSLIGAAIGAVIGGPAGAAAGAVLGAGIGSHVAHESDHGKQARVEHRHYSRAYIERRPVRYVAPVAYADGNGGTYTSREVASTVYCPPETVRYREKVVYRDKPTRVVHAPAPRPKMKKVCRYVPVKATTTAATASRHRSG